MLKLILLSAWLWGYIIGKFIIWPRRLQGFLWYPYLYASNWYRITDMKGKCLYMYLTRLYVFENTTCLFSFVFLPSNTIPVFLFVSHAMNNLWWPTFIEIKYSFLTCFLLSIIQLISCIIHCFQFKDYIVYVFFNILILCTYIWHTWISGYAYFVIKTPTTFIEYQERKSRETMEV